MQAIQTRYFGPTNVRGSRVKASAQAGSIMLDWDDALDSDANHCAAALALARKLNWTYGTWHGGGMPKGDGCVFVCADRPDMSFRLDV